MFPDWTKASRSRHGWYCSHYTLTLQRKDTLFSYSLTFPLLCFQFLYFSVGYLESVIWNLLGNGIFIEYFQHRVYLTRYFMWPSLEVKIQHLVIFHPYVAWQPWVPAVLLAPRCGESLYSLSGGSCPSSSWMAVTGFFILWVIAASEKRGKQLALCYSAFHVPILLCHAPLVLLMLLFGSPLTS